jgi:murein L,D-transpeptidase YafK
MARQSHIRSLALAGAILFAAGPLPGCVTVDSGSTRHLVPVPAALQAAMAEKGMSQADPIFVRVFKKESELEVWKRDSSGKYALLKTWPICRWSGQLGPKRRTGDRQAPEGMYAVTSEQMNPRSQFHLSFNLGYPNALEESQGLTGSALMVHGACTSAGCFAMTDSGMSEIYALAREAFAGGQKSFQVQALPFRMTAENMARHRGSPHSDFWRNLKEGVDHFDVTRQPPRVAACGRRYVFNAASETAPLAPGQDCPAITVDPAIQPLVAAKQRKDEARVAEIVQSGAPAAAASYADGGMHLSFRRTLQAQGPAHLQSITSGRVEVSRPDAALADPYQPDVSTSAAAGAITR